MLWVLKRTISFEIILLGTQTMFKLVGKKILKKFANTGPIYDNISHNDIGDIKVVRLPIQFAMDDAMG